MIEALIQHEFLRNALFAGLLASVACGVIGSLVVIRRLSYLAGGISHACFGGIGLAYFLGFPPVLGAVAFALLGALGIGLADRKLKQRAELTISVIWSGGMAIGILLLALTPGYAPDLSSFLFGNILFVPQNDLWLMLLLDGVILGTVALLFRPMVAVAYDEEFVAVGNLPVLRLYLLQLLLIALTVVVLIRVVGIILVIALLTIPAAIALQVSQGLKGMMLRATLLGMAFTVTGLVGSYYLERAGLPAPSGALIILVTVLAYGVSGVWRVLLRTRGRPRPAKAGASPAPGP